jgi:hypothetical protein
MANVEKALVTAVVITAASEFLDGIEEYLIGLGASGYTVTNADGRGKHGPRKGGALTMGNVRIESLLPHALAEKLLEHVSHTYTGRELTAYAHEVRAVPKAHFE